MPKQNLLFLIAATMAYLLNACVTVDGSSIGGAKVQSDTNLQFIQLADGWHSFDLPSGFHGGYEPAYSLTVIGKLHRQSAGRLEFQPHTEFQRHTYDSRVDSLVIANVFRPRKIDCHPDQLILSDTWNRISSGQAADDKGRVRVGSPPNDCYHESPEERMRTPGQEGDADVRQYIGVLRDGRFVYMICDEGDDPLDLAKCELETAWRSANLYISFAARHSNEWKKVVELVDEKINAAHVAAHKIDSLGPDDLDVKLTFNGVSFRIPAEFVDEVAEKLPRIGAEDWWIKLEARYSRSGKRLTAIKSTHKTGYRYLEYVPHNLTISINTPRYAELSKADVILADVTDWSKVSGDFESAGASLGEPELSSLEERDPDAIEYPIRASGELIGQLICKEHQTSKTRIFGSCSHFIKRDGIAFKIDTRFTKEVDLTSLYQAIEDMLSGFSKS